MSNKFLSDRVNNMEVSATIEMNQLSREMKNDGLDVISLSLGEPDFNTPEIVKEAAKKALDDNFTKYPPIAGFEDLKEAISNKFRRENNIDYKPNQIVVSTGAKQSIANVVLALVNKDDEVILPAPYWVSYLEQIKLAEGKVVEVETSVETNFKLTPEQLRKAITNKTKLIIFSSPCNPSGSLYSEEELKALGEVILEHEGIFVIADEIYEYINFTGEKHASMASIPELYDRVITVNGVAKGFAMTGWRIGYIGAPLCVAQACGKIQGQFTSGANAIAQKASLVALNEGANLSTEMLNAFKRRRDLVYKLLTEIPNIKLNLPEGAFYFFPDVSAYFGKSYKNFKINNSKDLCKFILKKGLVGVVPGEAFGAPKCIRISYASSDEVLTEAMNRIKATLSLLNV